MDCDVCLRPFNGRRKPFCSACTLATLYQPRVLQVTSLLAREKSHSHAEAIVRPGNDGVLAALPEDIDFDAVTTGMKKHGFQRYQVEQQIVTHRISAVTESADRLRKQIEEYKLYLADRKDDLAERRKSLSSGATDLERLRPRMLEPIQSTTRKTIQRLEKTTDRIVDSRALLCREAALACGLQKRRGPRDRSEYVIGGIAIPDLRELSVRSRNQSPRSTSSARTLAEPHALITASLDDVARLLSITAHYLSVRLPAEIVLPNSDSPRCMIMPEKSSYKQSDIHLASQTSSQSNSPAASRIADSLLPRPRPLFLDYPLAHLSKEDPKSYGLFIEGMVLLAWNLAWLCRTQGMDNINTFEEFCMIGRNLWQLVVTQGSKQSQPFGERRVSTTPDQGPTGQDPVTACLGLYSHASAGHNLANAKGSDLLKDWKHSSPARIADRLKMFLLTEIQGAEWDLLEEQEWEQQRDDELPVLVGGSRRPQDSLHPAMSVMTVTAHESTAGSQGNAIDDRKKGSSGWTKIRGRNQGT